MITKPMDVLSYYEVRKSRKQKTAFITAVAGYAATFQYDCKIEQGSFGSRNIIISDPARAKYLVTAHYDTCAWMPVSNFITPCNFFFYLIYQILITVGIFALSMALGYVTALHINEDAFVPLSMIYLYVILGILIAGPANQHTANDNTSGVVTLLEIMTTFPKNLQDRVAFVLFDLEEAGLIGSSSYRSKHRAQIHEQIILNLDCVGDGDEIIFFPTDKLRKDKRKMAQINIAKGKWGQKAIVVHEKGFAFYPSDQIQFPYGVGIAALRRNNLLGLYCGRIHTHRDTILDLTNVNILRAALITLISNGSSL